MNNPLRAKSASALCVSPLGAIWQFPIPLATQVWLGCPRRFILKGRPLRGAAMPLHLPSSHRPRSAGGTGSGATKGCGIPRSLRGSSPCDGPLRQWSVAGNPPPLHGEEGLPGWLELLAFFPLSSHPWLCSRSLAGKLKGEAAGGS